MKSVVLTAIVIATFAPRLLLSRKVGRNVECQPVWGHSCLNRWDALSQPFGLATSTANPQQNSQGMSRPTYVPGLVSTYRHSSTSRHNSVAKLGRLFNHDHRILTDDAQESRPAIFQPKDSAQDLATE